MQHKHLSQSNQKNILNPIQKLFTKKKKQQSCYNIPIFDIPKLNTEAKTFYEMSSFKLLIMNELPAVINV